MSDKICLVTGATSGIGEVTARELAAQGATVVVVGRNEEKCRAVVEEIRRATGNEEVAYLLADLSVQVEVRSLAQAFNAQYERLDVLVNNAGSFFMSRQESADGIEMTWALNHLAYFLLTELLLDTLLEGAPARIVNVASDAHKGAELQWDDLQKAKEYSGFGAYAQSKLANIMFTYELARRLEGTGVTVNAVHPGAVATNFWSGLGPVLGWIAKRIASLFLRSPQQGAETVIFLASSPEVEGVSRAYFADEKQVRSSDVSYDEAAQQRLWAVSEEMVRLA